MGKVSQVQGNIRNLSIKGDLVYILHEMDKWYIYRDKDKEIEFVYSKKVCMYCTSQCCVNVVPISTSDRMTVRLVYLWVNTGEE